MTDTPLILIPGAQHGAWCWRKMLRPLRSLGYEAHPITLTGLSERSHLLTADVDLNTHITDVVRLVEAEELIGVTLVGHSYGGLVAAGATARLRHPAVRRLVYLDSPIPLDGDSIMTMTPMGDHLPQMRKEIDGVGILAPGDAAAMGVHGEDLDWVQRRLTPHPYASVTTPVRLPKGWNDGVQQVYIGCTTDDEETQWADRSRIDESVGWRTFTLRSGHDAMIDQPLELTALLDRVCKDDAAA